VWRGSTSFRRADEAFCQSEGVCKMFWIVSWDTSYDCNHKIFIDAEEAYNYMRETARWYDNVRLFQAELITSIVEKEEEI
jgi:hypothetical protein